MAYTTREGPRALGPFVLGSRIAVGGMAEVFEARRADGEGPRLVVKVLLPQYARDSETVEALRHEAEIARTIADDRIVRVVAFGTDAGETWLAMERVDGGTLAELVERATGRAELLTLAAALHVGLELLGALEHVHGATSETGAPLDIVHRDVSPENVLVSRDGLVKLGDFGIARSVRRGGRTRTGVIKGKLAYLSPEQATGSATDARTDLYAAAVVIWELVTGARWLEGATEVELLRRAEDPPFRPPSAIASAPVALDAVLERALRRFPEERFASARAMRDALARVAESVGGDGRAELAAIATATFPPLADDDPVPTHVHGSSETAGGSDGSAHARAATSAAPRPWSTARGKAIFAVVATAAVVLGVRSLLLTEDEAPPAGSAAAVEPPTASARSAGDALVTAVARSEVDASDREPLVADGALGARAGETETLDAGQRTRARDPARPNDRDRVPRSASSSRPAEGDADASERTSAEAAGPPAADARAAVLRARRDAILESLRARGIRRADLPSPVDAQLREVDSALAESRWDRAASLLDALEPSASAIRVDAALVRRRLDRVGARIAAARRGGADTRALEDLAASALQGFLDGRYDETQRRLDDIEARLD